MPLRNGIIGPLSVIIVTIFILALPAAATDLSLDQVIGQAGTDSIAAEREVQFVIRLTNSLDGPINGFSHGFQLSSQQAITWEPLTVDTIPRGWESWFTFIFGTVYQSVDGSNADTVAIYGSDFGESGIPTTFDGQVWRIHTAFPASAVGTEVCLDSCYYPPGGQWLWTTDAGNQEYVPSWSGPHCFTIVDVPNVAPGITNTPDSIIGNHC
ncbi:hypothetical protein GF356_06695, partial [candidate division GN15 bacterium]|nr:hypothetical protein [candidate division GN15 bacterium]